MRLSIGGFFARGFSLKVLERLMRGYMGFHKGALRGPCAKPDAKNSHNRKPPRLPCSKCSQKRRKTWSIRVAAPQALVASLLKPQSPLDPKPNPLTPKTQTPEPQTLKLLNPKPLNP